MALDLVVALVGLETMAEVVAELAVLELLAE